MACTGAPASTASAGPAATGSGARLIDAVANLLASARLTTFTVTEAGAGKGVTYKPVSLILPKVLLPPATSFTVHFKALANSPVPVTVAVNCLLSPGVSVTEDGVSVTPVTEPACAA